MPRLNQAGDTDFRYQLSSIVAQADGQFNVEMQPSVRPKRSGNEVYYFRSDALVEKYRTIEDGVEQSFILQQNVAAVDQDVVLRGEVATAFRAEAATLRTLRGVAYLDGQQPILHYESPTVTDAAGRETSTELRLEGDQLDLVIDGSFLREAVYPVTVRASIRSCAATEAGTSNMNIAASSVIEAWPIWRIQLRVQMADVGYAGTDDNVNAQLNSHNLTWMDYGRNDFERNNAFTYDLVQESVSKLSDITMLRISKTGADGMCLRSITLYVNGIAIYALDFGAAGRWLDNDGYDYRTYTVSSAALRAHTLWANFPLTVPGRYLTRTELESRIESIVGHSIKGSKVYWGHYYGRAVEVTRKDDRTIHVDLDLSFDVLGPDPEVDFDFDVSFSCSGGDVILTIKNVNVDVDSAWYVDVLGGFVWLGLSEYIGDRIEKEVGTITRTLNTPYCPRMLVLSDGTLMMEF